MADLPQTISVGVNVFQVANLWGDHDWEEFLWGQGTAPLVKRVDKPISESISPSDAVTKNADHLISETLTVSVEPSDGFLQDSAGYFYVFTSDTTDGEERDFASYTSGASSSVSYSCGAVSATSWS